MNLNIELIQNESIAQEPHFQDEPTTTISDETESKEDKICPNNSTLEEAELVFIPALKFSKKVAILSVNTLMDYIKKAFKCSV